MKSFIIVLCFFIFMLVSCNYNEVFNNNFESIISISSETALDKIIDNNIIVSDKKPSDEFLQLEFKKVEYTEYIDNNDNNTDYGNMTVSETYKLNNGAKLAFYTKPEKEISEFFAVYNKSNKETVLCSGISIGRWYSYSGRFIIDEYDNILGFNGYTVKYRNKVNESSAMLYIYVENMPFHLLDLQNIEAVDDIDGDGSCEVITDRYIYMSKNNTVYCASYIEQIQKYKSDDKNIIVSFIDSSTVLYDANTFVIYSDINMDANTGAYDSIIRTAVYKDGGFYFTSENISPIDYNKKYKTNSEKWSLYFNMIEDGLILECEDGRKYSYGDRCGTNQITTNGIQFDKSDSTDCTTAVINENEAYAALVFPVQRFTVDNPHQECAIVIDLGTGYILDNINVSVYEILNKCNPLEHKKLKLYQSDGSIEPKYSVTCVPSLSGDSFKFVFTLQTEDSAISLRVNKYYSFVGTTYITEPDEDSKQYTLNPSEEPPLNDYDQSISVPDFLDKEQQNLYRRAHAVYSMLHNSTTDIDYRYPPYGGDIKSIKINEINYIISQGRYKYWNDFKAMILSIFTQEYFDNLNKVRDGHPLFIEQNGILYYRDFTHGQDPFYYEPDNFELIKQTKNEIYFNIIGHFNYYFPGIYKPNEANLKEGDEFTMSYPTIMIKTEDGWRFSQYINAGYN